MTLSEVAKLLGKAALIDKRIVGEADVHVWHEIAGSVDYDTALAALTDHRANKPGVYFEPGHVVQYGKRQAGTNAGAPYNRTVAEATIDGTHANCGHGYADPARACGICRRGGVREVGAA